MLTPLLFLYTRSSSKMKIFLSITAITFLLIPASALLRGEASVSERKLDKPDETGPGCFDGKVMQCNTAVNPCGAENECVDTVWGFECYCDDKEDGSTTCDDITSSLKCPPDVAELFERAYWWECDYC